MKKHPPVSPGAGTQPFRLLPDTLPALPGERREHNPLFPGGKRNGRLPQTPRLPLHPASARQHKTRVNPVHPKGVR